MSIYRRLPGREANTLPKICVITVPWSQPIELIKQMWQTLVFPFDGVDADKAARLVFSVKGNQHSAVELKHNSVRVCVLCLLLCVCVCPFYLL